MADQLEIIFWETNRGVSPVVDFIESQPEKAQAKIVKVIEFFAERGLSLMNSSDFLAKIKGYSVEMYELRIRVSKIFYRIILGIKDGVVYLVHAFEKKSNKTPKRELNKASQRLALVYC